MKNITRLATICTILLFVSCQKLTNKADDSPSETVIYKLEAYNQLVNNSVVNIEITNEVPQDEIHISGNKELLATFTRKIENGILYLDNNDDNHHQISSSLLTAKINNHHLKSITLEGVGSIKGEKEQTNTSLLIKLNGTGNVDLSINNQTTDIQIEGVGSINLSGKTNLLKSSIDGTGNLNAENLQSISSINNITGIGNASIWSTNKIDVEITGIGNFYYKKSPNVSITSRVDGLGRIKERN